MPIADIELDEVFDPRVPKGGTTIPVDIPRNKATDKAYVISAIKQYLDARYGPPTGPSMPPTSSPSAPNTRTVTRDGTSTTATGHFVNAPGASKVEYQNPANIIPPTGHPALDFMTHAIGAGFEKPVSAPQGSPMKRAFGGLKDAVVNPAVAGQFLGRFVKRPGLGGVIGATAGPVYKQLTSPEPSLGGLATDVAEGFQSPVSTTIEKLRSGDIAGAFGQTAGTAALATPKTEAAITGGAKGGYEGLMSVDYKKTTPASGVLGAIGAATGFAASHNPWAGLATGTAMGAALPVIPPTIEGAFRGARAGAASVPWSPLDLPQPTVPEQRPMYGPQPDQRPFFGPEAPAPMYGPENMPMYGPEPFIGPQPQPPVYGPAPPVFPTTQRPAIAPPQQSAAPPGWQGPLPAPYVEPQGPAGLLPPGPRFFVDPSGYASEQPQSRTFAGHNLVEPGLRPEPQRPVVSPDIQQFAQEQVAPALRQDQLANQGKEPSVKRAVEGLKKAEEPKKAAPVVEMPRGQGRPALPKHGDLGLTPVKSPKVAQMPDKPPAEPAKDFKTEERPTNAKDYMESLVDKGQDLGSKLDDIQSKLVDAARRGDKASVEQLMRQAEYIGKQHKAAVEQLDEIRDVAETVAKETGPAPKPTEKLTWSTVQKFAESHKDGFSAAQLAEKYGVPLDEVHKTLGEMKEENMVHNVGGYYKPGQAPAAKPKVEKPSVKKPIAKEDASAGPETEAAKMKPVAAPATKPPEFKQFKIQSPKEIEMRGRRMELQDKEVLTDKETAELEDLNSKLEGFKKPTQSAETSVKAEKERRYNEINNKTTITRKELEEHSSLAEELKKPHIENWLSQDEIGRFKDELGVNFTDAARILMARGIKVEPSKFGRGTYELRTGKSDLQALINRYGANRITEILDKIKKSD